MAASMERDENECSVSAFLEPLTLGGSSPRQDNSGAELLHSTKCLFCEQHFDVSEEQDTFLGHLVMKHQLVIAEFKTIPNFQKYMEYWRVRFTEKPLEEFCTVIKTNSKETDQAPSEYYYLLCDVLPEDRQLRLDLQQDRLQGVLEQQQREREDESFNHSCLFCRENFSGNKWDIFHHLSEEHAFNVGHPDNLVYKAEFIRLLQETLDGLQCLYCEKTFKDRHVLKEHMRKKLHKKINAQNKKYDKFYIINYLELGKTWEDIQSEDDRDLEVSQNDDWDDWKQDAEAAEDTSTVCLFCTLQAANAEEIIEHLKIEHGFDLHAIKQSLTLTFYQQVKLINYISRRIHTIACSLCEESYSTRDDLLHHLTESGHTSQIPPETAWDHPEYFFPTYENDNLLCALDDEESDESHPGVGDDPAVVDGLTVVPEEIHINEAMARGSELMEELRN